MYGNMTREEMIQRLYEGNFTTGELERQLIAKLFEQCCGGGGSSGGGGVYLVNSNPVGDDPDSVSMVLDKTAKEIYEAYQSSIIIISKEVNGSHYFSTIIKAALLNNGGYVFCDNERDFVASTEDDYPVSGDK